MTRKLSPTMRECVEFMREHDGRIERRPGGYWVRPLDMFTETVTVDGAAVPRF